MEWKLKWKTVNMKCFKYMIDSLYWVQEYTLTVGFDWWGSIWCQETMQMIRQSLMVDLTLSSMRRMDMYHICPSYDKASSWAMPTRCQILVSMTISAIQRGEVYGATVRFVSGAATELILFSNPRKSNSGLYTSKSGA